jgi:L-methionine (R)-S-oxide reductase
MDTNRAEELTSWLTRFLADARGVAGTIHLHENGGLRLGAAVNIPEPVRRVVEWVPSGKGMAGLALERGEPVQTCNLQEDRSGAVKPGAAAVDAKAAVAMPVRDRDGSIIAVVGIAFPDDREIGGEELERLTRAADSLVAAHRSGARGTRPLEE